MAAGATGASGRGAAGSAIVFDRNEGRFVNSTNARPGDSAQAPAGTAAEANQGNAGQTQRGMKVYPASRSGNDARVPPASDRVNAREGPGRQSTPAARNTPPPPNVPRSVTSERVFNQTNAGGGRATGSTGAGGAASGASRGPAPSAGGGAGGGGRSSGGGSGGGGTGRRKTALGTPFISMAVSGRLRRSLSFSAGAEITKTGSRHSQPLFWCRGSSRRKFDA
jgi:hypothetical protein